MASLDYETTARGYKVVYNAPADFFSYEHCSDCAEGGDAVLMEEGECPRCGCYRSYKRWECCDSCDREWAEARERDTEEEPAVSRQDYLVYTSLEDLRNGLEQITAELPALAEDTREDALGWKAAYEAEIARRETLKAAGEPYDPEEEAHRDLIADLLKARANYHSALMSDPSAPGWDRMCANLDDEVQELAQALQEELWECDEERKLLGRRSRAAGRTELNEKEQEEMDAMDEWAQRAFDALHPR